MSVGFCFCWFIDDVLRGLGFRRHHARRSPSTGSTHSVLSVHSPTRSSGASSPVLFNNTTPTNTHGKFFIG